jgi:hypothetical protein
MKYSTINEILQAYPNHTPKQIANIKNNADILDVESLGDYLKEKFYDTEYQKSCASAFKKLVALYDFKKYK